MEQYMYVSLSIYNISVEDIWMDEKNYNGGGGDRNGPYVYYQLYTAI